MLVTLPLSSECVNEFNSERLGHFVGCKLWHAIQLACDCVLSSFRVVPAVWWLQVLGLGITNQRETTLVWSRSTGQPLYNAIVWLDNRTRCGFKSWGGWTT